MPGQNPTGFSDRKQPMANGEKNKVVGPDALARQIREFMMGREQPITSCHHAHQPETEILSPTTTTGIWPMEDHLWWQNGDQGEFLHGYGHNYENYRKEEGQ